MKTKKSLFLSCLMGVATCCLLNPAWSASLSFEPGSTVVDVGDSFEVEIWVSGLNTELTDFDFNILYDFEMLSFVNYSLGIGLGTDVDPENGLDADSWDISFGDDGAGTLNLAEFSWLEEYSSQTDSMLLATVTFSTLSTETSTIRFDPTYCFLGNLSGYIEADITSTVTVNPTQTAPVPEPATGLLFGMGIAGLAALQRRRRQQYS